MISRESNVVDFKRGPFRGWSNGPGVNASVARKVYHGITVEFTSRLILRRSRALGERGYRGGAPGAVTVNRPAENGLISDGVGPPCAIAASTSPMAAENLKPWPEQADA